VNDHLLLFIPGIMGTELRYVGEGRYGELTDIPVWSENLVTLLDSLAVNPDSLDKGRELQVGAVLRELRFHKLSVKKLYGPLLDFLMNDKDLKYREDDDLKAFGYDWRKDNRETAGRLAEFMRCRIMQGVERFKIIAHSMGGIVTRLLLADPANADLAARTALFVQIGVPVRGSSKAFYTLKHSPEMSWMVDALMALRGHIAPVLFGRLMGSIRSFDSLFQLLPHESEHILATEADNHYSALDEQAWKEPYRDKLDAALEVHQILRNFSFPRTITFYSTEIITDSEYLVDGYFNVVKKIPSFAKGDGTVTIASAVLNTPPAKRVPILDKILHDSLPCHRALWERLAEELRK
jgi:pimeloyl-ACP methyl ester carboxylesterase